MNTSRILNITRKDLFEVTRNKAVWTPMLVVPLFFVILLPVGFSLAIRYIPPEQMQSMNQLQSWVAGLPLSMQNLVSGLTPAQQMGIMILGVFMAPMFLVMPMMFSSIIAAESFAGEKERKTLEGLLYTPASDLELFAGKTLAAVIPAVVIAWFSFGLYCLVVIVATVGIMPAGWFPLDGWYPLIFWVTPAVAALGTMFTVLISARVNTFMEAYQSGSALVILVLGLVAGQMTGFLFLDLLTGFIVGCVVLGIDFVLLRVCLHLFRRNRLIATVG
jgi:ABC-2 type transport system permease protein